LPYYGLYYLEALDPFLQVIGKYKDMVCLITSYEEMAFKGWTESVESLTTENLDEPLLARQEDGTLRVNFGKHLMGTLIEVKHLKKDFSHRAVPENVKKIFQRFAKFRNSKNILDQTVTRFAPPLHPANLCDPRYNYLKQNTVPAEAALIEEDVLSLDERLKQAEMTLNWHCEDVKDYLEDVQVVDSHSQH
jgi:hypothetical protein